MQMQNLYSLCDKEFNNNIIWNWVCGASSLCYYYYYYQHPLFRRGNAPDWMIGKKLLPHHYTTTTTTTVLRPFFQDHPWHWWWCCDQRLKCFLIVGFKLPADGLESTPRLPEAFLGLMQIRKFFFGGRAVCHKTKWQSVDSWELSTDLQFFLPHYTPSGSGFQLYAYCVSF